MLAPPRFIATCVSPFYLSSPAEITNTSDDNYHQIPPIKVDCSMMWSYLYSSVIYFMCQQVLCVCDIVITITILWVKVFALRTSCVPEGLSSVMLSEGNYMEASHISHMVHVRKDFHDWRALAPHGMNQNRIINGCVKITTFGSWYTIIIFRIWWSSSYN